MKNTIAREKKPHVCARMASERHGFDLKAVKLEKITRPECPDPAAWTEAVDAREAFDVLEREHVAELKSAVIVFEPGKIIRFGERRVYPRSELFPRVDVCNMGHVPVRTDILIDRAVGNDDLPDEIGLDAYIQRHGGSIPARPGKNQESGRRAERRGWIDLADQEYSISHFGNTEPVAFYHTRTLVS
jgi:hypothetical protein